MLHAPWLLAAAAAVHVFADTAGTFDVSNRAETRIRDTQPIAQGTPNPSLDLADTVTARLGLATRTWTYTLGYSAMLMALDTEISIAPQLLEFADVGATWHDRRVTVGVAEFGSYGEFNFAQTGPIVAPGGTTSPTTGPTAPTAVPLLTSGIVRFGSSRTLLRAVDQLARRWTLTLSVEYTLFGGMDGASQAVMPLVRGPRADAVLSHRLTRIDSLETEVLGQRSDTSSGVCSPLVPSAELTNATAPCAPAGQIVQATEAWRRTLSHTTGMYLGVGVSASQLRFQDVQPGFDTSIFPVATAGLQYARRVEGKMRSVRLDLALAPFVDLRTGLIDQRAQVTGTLSFPTKSVTYLGSLGATRSVESPFVLPLTAITGSFEAEYEVSRAVGVGAGVRYFWQEQQTFGDFSLTTVFAQVTVRAPTQRF